MNSLYLFDCVGPLFIIVSPYSHQINTTQDQQGWLMLIHHIKNSSSKYLRQERKNLLKAPIANSSHISKSFLLLKVFLYIPAHCGSNGSCVNSGVWGHSSTRVCPWMASQLQTMVCSSNQAFNEQPLGQSLYGLFLVLNNRVCIAFSTTMSTSCTGSLITLETEIYLWVEHLRTF